MGLWYCRSSDPQGSPVILAHAFQEFRIAPDIGGGVGTNRNDGAALAARFRQDVSHELAADAAALVLGKHLRVLDEDGFLPDDIHLRKRYLVASDHRAIATIAGLAFEPQCFIVSAHGRHAFIVRPAHGDDRLEGPHADGRQSTEARAQPASSRCGTIAAWN